MAEVLEERGGGGKRRGHGTKLPPADKPGEKRHHD